MVSKSVVDRIFMDRDFVNLVVLDINKQKVVLADLVYKIAEVKSMKVSMLTLILKTLQLELQIFWGLVWKFIATDFPNECLSPRLTQILESQGYLKLDVNEIISVFSSPDISSLKLGKYHQSLIKHGASNRIKEEFAWIHWNYDEGQHLDEELMKKDIEHARNLGLNPVIKNVEIQNCLEKYNISSDVESILRDVLTMAQVKADAKEVVNEVSYMSQILFKELENRLDIPLDLLKFLLPDELQSVDTIDKDFMKELENRKSDQCIFMIIGEKIMIIQGDDIQNISIHKESHPAIKSDSVLLHGNCAYNGKIVGKVCIIKGDSQAKIKKFREGSILVSVNTSPNMISIMTKAIGIITDIGGITSHAAIVARELKIPCITGTKIATKILKDGDLIEMDADSGVVSLIR